MATGLSIELPPGYEAQIRPRSGMAFKYGVTVANAPGTIDPAYRGEIKVILINHGRSTYMIEPGDRIMALPSGLESTIASIDTADGQRIIQAAPIEGTAATPLTLVHNWPARLKK